MKLSFEHISKFYGDTAALQQIDLTSGQASMACSVQTEPGKRR